MRVEEAARQEEPDTCFKDAESAAPHLRIGFASFNENGLLVLYSRAFAELLGLPHEALSPGLPFHALVISLRSQNAFASPDGQAFLSTQLTLDRAHPSAARHVRPCGQVIELASDPMPSGGWTIAAVDVSSLCVAEQNAQRARVLDSILDCIPHGICVYGPDRHLSMVNPAYHQIMRGAPVAVGDSVESIIKRRAHAGEFGPGDPDSIIHQQMGHDTSRPQTRRRRRPNGSTIDIRTAPLPEGG